MAKIIVSCRFQKSAKDMADLIRYMATREGVEKLPNSKRFNIASSKQHDLILSVVKHFPQSKKFLEYDDYYAMPTRENANEFLDAVAERYTDRADELKGLVSYILILSILLDTFCSNKLKRQSSSFDNTACA